MFLDEINSISLSLSKGTLTMSAKFTIKEVTTFDELSHAKEACPLLSFIIHNEDRTVKVICFFPGISTDKLKPTASTSQIVFCQYG